MGSFHRRTFLTAAAAAALAPARGWADTPLFFSNQPLAFARIAVGNTPATALLDTGGVRGVQISGNLADALHIELTSTTQVTQRYQNGGAPIRTGAADVTVDDRTWMDEEVSVAAGDIERISEQIGHSFDAILGWRFLSREGFSADFARGRFTIGAGSGQQALPFDDSHGVPISAGRVGAIETGVLIDTGAPTCALDVSIADGAEAGAVVQRTLTLGARAIQANFRVHDLSALTRGAGAKAVFGLEAMRGKTLAFDPRTRVLTLD
jgi:hypothetical protein